MEESTAARIARRWLRRRPHRWTMIAWAAAAAVFVALVPLADTIEGAAFRAAMAAMCWSGAIISFQRRAFGAIVDRLEGELAGLRRDRER